MDEHGVAAVLLGNQTVFGQLSLDLVRVGAFLIHLVHCDDDRHVGRLGVVERLNGLRHDAVVRCDNQHRDVGDAGTTGTHGGERLVTGGVDEGDRAFRVLHLVLDLVGTDVLGDPAVLALDDLGVADGVKEARLTVVDVAHDGDNRRTCLKLLVAFGLKLGIEVDVEAAEQLALFVLGGNDLDQVAQLGSEHLEGVLVE